MNSLTVGYITSRKEPKIEWAIDSLLRQMQSGEHISVIVVDYYQAERDFITFSVSDNGKIIDIRHVDPKPTIWQGKYQLPKEPWWAKSSAINTAICLCETEWIAFVDDRSVPTPGWLDRIKLAMAGPYAVCGYYEKHKNLKVENGEAVGSEELLGADTRTPGLYSTDGWYGGHGALPLEWCLAVNGFSEDICDSLGSEDSMFGNCLYNAGFSMKYDSSMRLIEDRTPGQIDGALKRADKGVSPMDKSHAIVDCFRGQRTSMNSYNIRDLRERVLAGEPFPPPTAADTDWFDGQPIREMT